MPREGRQSNPTLTTGRWQTPEAFQANSDSHKYKRNLDSARKFKVAHEFEDSGSHHKIWLDSVTSSILQPRYSILRFPPIWSPEECSPQYEVRDWRYDLRSGWELGYMSLVQTQHTHLFIVGARPCKWTEILWKNLGIESNHHSSQRMIFTI